MSSNDSASLNMLQTLGIALGLSLLLGVAASFRDLTCLEGFDLIADSGKGTALVGAMLVYRTSSKHPLQSPPQHASPARSLFPPLHSRTPDVQRSPWAF